LLPLHYVGHPGFLATLGATTALQPGSYQQIRILARVGPEGTLRRGDVLEGAVLAESLHPIPERYHPGGFMAVTLSIFDQFDSEHQADLDLWVDCWKENATVRPARSSLFEPSLGLYSTAPAGDVPNGSIATTLGKETSADRVGQRESERNSTLRRVEQPSASKLKVELALSSARSESISD